MTFIIIIVAAFFIITALTSNNEEIADQTTSNNYSYTAKTEGKYLYLTTNNIPHDTEILFLEINYQGQAVKSYHDLFNDKEGDFIAKTSRNDGSYTLVVPLNALMLPRNKDINLDFRMSLWKNGDVVDQLNFQETTTITSSSFVMMEWFAPALDILGYYAVKKGDGQDANTWTKENIQTIKNIFAQYIDMNQEEQDFLKNQLKLISKRSINLRDSVKEFIIRSNTMADRNVVFYTSTRIILNNVESGKWRHIEKGIAEIEHLGKLLSISDEVLEDAYSAIEQFKNETQNSSTGNFDTIKALNILGLSEGATVEEMRRAYRLKMKDFHPDKHTSLPESVKLVIQEKAQELNLAKEILGF